MMGDRKVDEKPQSGAISFPARQIAPESEGIIGGEDSATGGQRRGWVVKVLWT